MTTTRSADTTALHDARHCGHVGRSESPYVKRASILFACEQEIPAFEIPANEPAPVMALLAAMRRGVECEALAEVTNAFTTVESAPVVASALVLPHALIERMVAVVAS